MRIVTSIGAAFEGFDDVLEEIHGLGHAQITLVRVPCDHPMESYCELKKKDRRRRQEDARIGSSGGFDWVFLRCSLERSDCD